MPGTSAEYDPLVDEAPRRYVVGIDLGTTNSAVAFVDTEQQPWAVHLLKVPQLVAPAQVEARDTLPSFHYQAVPQELSSGAFRLPWNDHDPDWAVGVLAREEGTRSPGRLISSAKSWLCHTGVDRTAELLPWHADPDVDRFSPVAVTARYLRHVRDAWDDQFPSYPLARQDLVITLPASFDEVARELTVEAAAQAGLARAYLIEEPQAAFYAWVYKHDLDWQDRVHIGQTILVCDIGGGTSDFTLIRVRPAAEDEQDGNQRIQFHRVAVGDHLILGGDNLDLALARYVEQKLAAGGRLEPHQWDVLLRSSRRVKETLLGHSAPDRATVHLPGTGSRVIGSGLGAEVTREEVERLLLEGFLPETELGDRPAMGQSGFRELGLPFASDPAITRHLAAFLQAHGEVARDGDPPAATGQRSAARPDILLFNGGFFASPVLRARLMQVLASWFSQPDQDWRPQVLDNDRLDLAVARGAAYYGMVRRGEGVRIAADLARSYYIGVEQPDRDTDKVVTICLVPGNTQPGQDVHLPGQQFSLAISQPVEFALYVSSVRLTDRPGQCVPLDREQMRPLPPIRTVLQTERRKERGTVPVTLHAHLSEIGTIELWCSAVDSDRSWRLQFDVRSATQTDIAPQEALADAQGVVDEQTWERCEAVLDGVFASDGQEQPGGLARRLATALGSDRHEWPTSLLRRMWDALMQREAGRRRSAAHEARWLNLLGFSLRPGYGMAVDDWRVATTWRTVRGKLAHNTASSQNESLILWRRIAGGLSAGQQQALAEPLLSSLRVMHAVSMQGKKPRVGPAIALHQSNEAWRLLGSMELLPVSTKVRMGETIVDLFPKRKFESVRAAMIWALGRVGQRVPLYGPLNTVVPTAKASEWLQSLMKQAEAQPHTQLAVMQMAYRTDDRYRDVSESLRAETAGWLSDHQAPRHLLELVRQGGQLASDEQDRIFGEQLPLGLRAIGTTDMQ